MSQSIETMFAADPKGEGGSTFAQIKGVIGFASAIGGIANGIKIKLGGLTTEQKKELVGKPDANDLQSYSETCIMCI